MLGAACFPSQLIPIGHMVFALMGACCAVIYVMLTVAVAFEIGRKLRGLYLALVLVLAVLFVCCTLVVAVFGSARGRCASCCSRWSCAGVVLAGVLLPRVLDGVGDLRLSPARVHVCMCVVCSGRLVHNTTTATPLGVCHF